MRWPCVISIALALAGCKDKEATKLAQVKSKVCACKDTKCAEAALKDLPSGPVKAGHKSQLLARDMQDCLAKLYEQERPQTGPDVNTAGSADVSAPAGAAVSAPGSAAAASAGTP